ncbi:MAG: hypothetical protein ACOX1V_03405 [Candidatus Iainarchaeum sp.]|jgi:predicted PurR-regulated permease PerM
MSKLVKTIDGIAVLFIGIFISATVLNPVKVAFNEVFCGFGSNMCIYSFLLLFVLPLAGAVYSFVRILPKIIEFIENLNQ